MNQRVVFKYGPLDPMARQEIQTIRGRVVHVGSQDGRSFVWVLGYPTMPPISRPLVVFATGQTIANENLMFVGTAVTPEGFVWHVFEDEVEL